MSGKTAELANRVAYRSDEDRWLAVRNREAEADGQFVYCVATTGVYCRPTCPSRLALRKNVGFYDTSADAERRPQEDSQAQRQIEAATHACRLIESSETRLTLDMLASAVGISRYHFHRVFKKIVGVTPRQYAAEHRADRVKSGLRSERSITHAIYGAGFNSSGRFYEQSSEILGMTPVEYRKGGHGTEISFAIASCRLGLVLVAGTARGICCVRFGDDSSKLEKELRQDFPRAAVVKAGDHISAWLHAVVDHIEDPSHSIDLPLDIAGTAFQQRVWQALRKIPMGQTSTYAKIAALIRRPSAARAVARACATNPVAIVVPCHRVVRSDGSLSGYFWGVERKRKLLELEGAIQSTSDHESSMSK